MLTQREVFDRVKEHLLKQGDRAEGFTRTLNTEAYTWGCVYRAPDGKMCAIGCLLEDEHYSDKLEGHPVDTDVVMSALEKSGVPALTYINMLTALQDIHDRISPSLWERKLDLVESKYLGGL